MEEHSSASKKVLAKEIAKQLEWKFINADILDCVANIDHRVYKIFDEDGKQHFNQLLNEILQQQMIQENIVITTDEDVVCDEKVRNLLKAEFTIYLEASMSVQLADYRPLLPIGALLNELHDECNNLYTGVASFTLNSDNSDVKNHAKSVIAALGE